MKKQFDLSLWLKDKSRKVVTRDGREVEILKTNRKDGIHPIIFTILDPNGIEQVHFCNKVGICTTLPSPNKFDLFFADNEEELTEFESALMQFAHDSFDSLLDVTKGDALSKWKDKLLDLTKKEIGKEDWKTPLRAYKNGYKQGKQDALKYLPKWKKATEHLRGEGFIHYDKLNMAPQYADTNVEGGEYYLTLDDLKTLPKEE